MNPPPTDPSPPPRPEQPTLIQRMLAMALEERDALIREQSERAAVEYANDPEVQEWLDLDEAAGLRS